MGSLVLPCELLVCGVYAKSLQSFPTLLTLWTVRQAGSLVHGILQKRILECVAIPSSRGFSRPGDQTQVSYMSCIGRWLFYH